MVSLTTKTRRRRRIRKKQLGRDQKRERANAGTPKFPIHPEGLDRSESKSSESASGES